MIDETLAVVPVGQWRAMQARLATTPEGGRKQPRAMRRQTSGVLSGLMCCADPSHEKPQRMYRGTLGSKDRPRPVYY